MLGWIVGVCGVGKLWSRWVGFCELALLFVTLNCYVVH
jgi:hypothetical protein